MFDEQAFYQALEEWRTRTFDRSESNCCHFTSDMVRRSVGTDVGVPTTSTPEEASHALKDLGSNSLYQYMRKLFGKALPPLQGRIGYVAYRSASSDVFQPTGEATIGIVERGCAWFLSSKGLRRVRLSHCTKVFKTY